MKFKYIRAGAIREHLLLFVREEEIPPTETALPALSDLHVAPEESKLPNPKDALEATTVETLGIAHKQTEVLSSIAETIKKESIPKELPPAFLAILDCDSPEGAARIKKDLPRWCREVDQLAGVPGLGRTIASRIRYIGKEETQKFINNTAREVESLLRTDPNGSIHFLACGKDDGSERYFFDQVLASLDPVLQSRIRFVRSLHINLPKQMAQEKTGTLHYFICDDSSNSGQQLSLMVNKFLMNADCPLPSSGWRAWLPRFLRPRELRRDFNLHVRLLGITDHASKKLDSIVKERAPNHTHVDLKAGRLPDMEDVLEELRLSPDNLSKKARHELCSQGHCTLLPILAFFHHKVQDNVPYALSHGSGLPGGPLLRESDIESCYKTKFG